MLRFIPHPLHWHDGRDASPTSRLHYSSLDMLSPASPVVAAIYDTLIGNIAFEERRASSVNPDLLRHPLPFSLSLPLQPCFMFCHLGGVAGIMISTRIIKDSLCLPVSSLFLAPLGFGLSRRRFIGQRTTRSN